MVTNRGAAPALLLEWALVGMLASSFLALVFSGAVDIPSALAAALAILLRAGMQAGLLQFQVPERAVTAAAIAYIGFYPIDYYYVSRDFLAATVHLVFFLTSVLVLRARTRRDFLFVKVIALVQILAGSLASVDFLFSFFLAVFALCGIVAQVSGEIRNNVESLQNVARYPLKGLSWRLCGLALFVFASVIAVGGAIFVLVPRTARSAFQHFQPEGLRVPGLSSEVRLGEIGQIMMSRTPVFHARFYGQEQIAGLKWRGSALALFDGGRWYNEPEAGERLTVENRQVTLSRPNYAVRQGRRVAYEVQLNNLTSGVLLFAGTPEVLRIDAPEVLRTAVDGYRATSGRSHRYQAYSLIEDGVRQPSAYAPVLSEEARMLYLRMPRLDRRVVQLATQVSAGAASELTMARALERYLERSYGYTTKLPDRVEADPIAHFLFERKEGHCEYFASAMAVMLRTLGIPSRIATGFQPGVFNPITGWHLVRASEAHSWVEAFLRGYGWVSFDPTPPDPLAGGATLWSRFQLYADAAEVFWQEWVLSYDLERQVMLADRLARSSRSSSVDWMRRWSGLQQWTQEAWAALVQAGAVMVAAVGSGLLLLIGAPRLLAWWRTRRRVDDLRQGIAAAGDATLLYGRMLGMLNRRGISKPSWMTPGEFAAAIPEGRRRALVRELTANYHALRYGGQPGSGPRMVVLLEQLDEEPSDS